MKVQEVILKAMAGSLRWWEAAEIIGVSDRTMRRWRERYQEHGYDGLYDRRKNRPSPKRVPVKTVEEVLQLVRANPDGLRGSGILFNYRFTTLRHLAVAFGRNVVIVSLSARAALSSGRITAASRWNCR